MNYPGGTHPRRPSAGRGRRRGGRIRTSPLPHWTRCPSDLIEWRRRGGKKWRRQGSGRVRRGWGRELRRGSLPLPTDGFAAPWSLEWTLSDCATMLTPQARAGLGMQVAKVEEGEHHWWGTKTPLLGRTSRAGWLTRTPPWGKGASGGGSGMWEGETNSSPSCQTNKQLTNSSFFFSCFAILSRANGLPAAWSAGWHWQARVQLLSTRTNRSVGREQRQCSKLGFTAAGSN